jgi:hypothetical protein
VLLAACAGWPAAAQTPHQPIDTPVTQPWTGEWQTYWRGGSAVMTLQQDGERVTGRY